MSDTPACLKTSVLRPVFLFVYIYMCVCVCVCFCVREREMERERKLRESVYERGGWCLQNHAYNILVWVLDNATCEGVHNTQQSPCLIFIRCWSDSSCD